MPDLIELQKDKTLFEAKTEEVSLHKQIKQQENQIPPPEPEYERKQKQLSWTVAPQLQEKETLKGAKRAKFAKNEQLEQSMNDEEQILLKREEQSFQSLEKLFQEIHQPARHGLMFRRVLRKISQEMEQALQIFHAIQENKEEPAQLGVMREDCQKRLEIIYQLGKGYLNRRRSADQTELLRRIMMAADDAQLPSSRITLIQKERQYKLEDEAGYGHAEQNHDVMGLTEKIRKAIAFYTQADMVKGQQMAGYQFMNRLLRGQITEADLPKKNGVKNLILGMIRRLNTAFVSRQTETKSLYRGLNLYNVYKDRIYNPESLVGTTFSDKAYMSTSRNRDKSINFLNIEGMPDAAIDQFIKLRLKNPEAPPPEKIITGHSLMEIVARKGARSLDIEDVTEVKGEEEVLFPPGTRVYLRSMQLLNSVVVASRGKIAARVMMNYNPADAQRILQTVLPDDWNKVYINVSVPVFQGEIR